jgi:RNA-directed DNA polymerase
MAVGPPHLYWKQGLEKRIPETVLRNALDQAGSIRQRGLPPILSIRHLALLTGADYRYLRQLVGRRRDPYRTFQIRKRSGGHRIISVPEPPLLAVQRWLSANVLAHLPAHGRSFAYTPKSSILRCASEHVGCRWLVKLDVRRFFESIAEIRISQLFREFGYQPLVSFEMARLCTRVSEHRRPASPKWRVRGDRYLSIPAYRTFWLGHLPQGAPSSPMLANLVARRLDENLTRLAAERGLIYTRYADDLTFSTAASDFNRQAAKELISSVCQEIRVEGFTPHTAKTVVVPPGARKLVLGLLVDRARPRLTRQFCKRLTEHIRGIEKFGLIQHTSARRFDSVWGLKRHVEGLLAFAEMVQPELAGPLKKRFQEAVAASGWTGI